MDYLTFLREEAGILRFRFLAVSLVAALANGVLIFTVTSAASATWGASVDLSLVFLFLCSFLLHLLARQYMLDQATSLMDSVVRKIRVRVTAQLMQAELIAFEALGKVPILQALTQYCQILCTTAMSLTTALAGVGAAMAALVYLAVLSRGAFFFVVITITLLLLLYFKSMPEIQRRFSEGSIEDNRFMSRLNDQLEGFKELRIHSQKAKDLYENDLVDSALRTEQLRHVAQRKLNLNSLLVYGFFYLLLGLMVFVYPSLADPERVSLTSIASVTLFLLPFLRDIINAVPKYFRASEAVDRLQALEQALSGIAQVHADDELPEEPFQSLRLEKAGFAYPNPPGEDDHGFRLGPIDLEIQRGEIVFFVGGNGSGKSTLLHVLCGLYSATSGRLLLNGSPVNQQRLPSLRACFSIVLPDFHLFQRLLGKPPIHRERLAELLSVLRVSEVTDIDEEGRFSNLDVSQGQKKRLALLVTECDDREVLLFDEWAADQDPAFRRYFYEEYLPNLRSRGKTILAATHDDRYFSIADRLVRLERGRLIDPTSNDTVTPVQVQKEL